MIIWEDICIHITDIADKIAVLQPLSFCREFKAYKNNYSPNIKKQIDLLITFFIYVRK